eukprot:CAMPEP_0175091244 /NCGR_PEP_ID=MMETSP0086_2-20121207/1795_1 /TAXON_ID=136419 /ORGANISM="Unknown Unknown, Strain D1" /LENGTH=531 /DNA_ID=CAMNT_0016363965 /DNA_START=38 /DNA_END=1633 /DNA_ORIENTATION=-
MDVHSLLLLLLCAAAASPTASSEAPSTGVNAMLIIIVIAMAVITGFAVVLMIVKFGHPDDKNVAKFPKIVTFLGLWLAFASVLIIPYDVANSRGQGGGLDVSLLWMILYITLAIICFGLIPYAFFFYESDPDPNRDKSKCCGSQAGSALGYATAFMVIIILVLVILFAAFNEAEVPVKQITQIVKPGQRLISVAALNNGTAVLPKACPETECLTKDFIWTINISFPVCVMATLALLGWFFFTFFVGVGLVALPVDLINEFRTRPKSISTKTWIEEKRDLAKRAGKLIEIGQGFQKALESTDASRKERKKLSKTLRQFEQNYYFLKKDYKYLEISHRYKGGNTLWYVFKLFLGIIGIAVSLTWIVHICLFILPSTPVHPFLNNYFTALEFPGFPLFGVCAFGTWSYYLMWACIKGNFKLGVRFLFWKIYPMEINNTMMNSFLFNTFIVLLCSVPTVQFCARAFPVYARYTDVNMLFGTQVQYMKGVSIFWEYNVFVIAMVVVSGLTGLFLFLKPNDEAARIEFEIAKTVDDY